MYAPDGYDGTLRNQERAESAMTITWKGSRTIISILMRIACPGGRLADAVDTPSEVPRSPKL